MEVFLSLLLLTSLLLWLSLAFRPSKPLIPVWEAEEKWEVESDLPFVSIVIPARNEEETIEEVLASHFKSDYPAYEVILVDDGSTDQTLKKAKEVAESENFREGCQFRIIQVGEREEGWSGKVYAMERGFGEAKGAYVLFTDADILWEPTLLRSLVSESLREGLGLNSRMALLSTEGFWEKVLVPAFLFFFYVLYPFREVSNPKLKTAAAAGGCMLVSRKALERAGGLVRIKDAIIDDIALARLIKAEGFPVRLCLSKRLGSLRRYRRLSDFWHTVTRTAFTELRYSFLRLALATLGLLVACVAPVAGFFLGVAKGLSVPGFLSAAVLILSWLSYLPALRAMRVPQAYAISFQLVAFLYLCMTWHSALRYLLGTKSVWKGRVYQR